MAEEDQNLMSVRDMVLEILETKPAARNSDMRLFFEVLEFKGIKVRLDLFMDLPNLETVRRERQVIQNEDHLWIPTNLKIILQRMAHCTRFKKWLREERKGTYREAMRLKKAEKKLKKRIRKGGGKFDWADEASGLIPEIVKKEETA